jgi:hypothetical protein
MIKFEGRLAESVMAAWLKQTGIRNTRGDSEVHLWRGGIQQAGGIDLQSTMGVIRTQFRDVQPRMSAIFMRQSGVARRNFVSEARQYCLYLMHFRINISSIDSGRPEINQSIAKLVQ